MWDDCALCSAVLHAELASACSTDGQRNSRTHADHAAAAAKQRSSPTFLQPPSRQRQAFDVVITSLAATATVNHPTIYDARRSRARYSLLAIGFAEDHPSRLLTRASPSEIDVSVSTSPYANSPALSLQPFPIAISRSPVQSAMTLILTALRRNNVTPHFRFPFRQYISFRRPDPSYPYPDFWLPLRSLSPFLE